MNNNLLRCLHCHTLLYLWDYLSSFVRVLKDMRRLLVCLSVALGGVTSLSEFDRHKSKSDYVSSSNAPCYDNNNTVFACPAKCFCDPTYGEDEVLDTDNIEYSEKYNLLLHLFEPPKSDKRLKRPAMVMIHGGGFKDGNRKNRDIVYWCYALAMCGYVTVSIDYRLDHPHNEPGTTFGVRPLYILYIRKCAFFNP